MRAVAVGVCTRSDTIQLKATAILSIRGLNASARLAGHFGPALADAAAANARSRIPICSFRATCRRECYKPTDADVGKKSAHTAHMFWSVPNRSRRCARRTAKLLPLGVLDQGQFPQGVRRPGRCVGASPSRCGLMASPTGSSNGCSRRTRRKRRGWHRRRFHRRADGHVRLVGVVLTAQARCAYCVDSALRARCTYHWLRCSLRYCDHSFGFRLNYSGCRLI